MDRNIALSSQPVRAALRSATAPWHDRVDRLYSTATLADRAQYARFLAGQAAAVLPIEDALERIGAVRVLDDWPSRRRGALLRADLAMLAMPIGALEAAPAFPSADAVLGAIYVLEGSRLGARLLQRRVPAGFPQAFLGADEPGGWRRLVTILETRLIRDDQRRAAIEAAIAVFEVFEQAASRHLLAV